MRRRYRAFTRLLLCNHVPQRPFVFQGERRFYLGGVVDDLFLSTGVWIYDPPSFFGPEVRQERSEAVGAPE